MKATLGRPLAGLFFALALVAPAAAQDTQDYLGKPETPLDYWKRTKFEIEVGKFDFAARFLKGFVRELGRMRPEEGDRLLYDIEEREGMSAFLRLNRIPSLLEDKKARREMASDVDRLLKRVDEAVHRELQKRLPRALRNLNRSPEERAWAIAQLDRLGEAAVPPLLRELQSTAGRAHDRILEAMLRLRSILPPLLAALDINDNRLRRDIIYLLREKDDKRAVPALWYPSRSTRVPTAVNAAATRALASLLDTQPSHLPPAIDALTKLAEQYYYHRVKFPAPDRVVVWQFDPKKRELASTVTTADRAEEYYGLRYARQALDLDPNDRPAQRVYLSLLLEKAYGSDLQMPLGRKAPRVKELLETVNPSLVMDVLDHALRDRKTAVALGAIQALGDLHSVPAARRGDDQGGAPVLARALEYPDRRVQMAAADAMLRIPGRAQPMSGTRIVQVLRRALMADPVPKVLLAYTGVQRSQDIAKNVQAAGYEPVITRTGKDAVARLKKAADIDAILIDYRFPGWEREFPFVLSQMRADIDVGLLPLIVTAPAGQDLRLRRYLEGYRNAWVEPEGILRSPTQLKSVLRERITQAEGRPLSRSERQAYAEAALDWLGRMARGEVRGYDVRPAEDAVLKAVHSSQVELVTGAIEILGRLPGREAQLALANVLLNPARDKLRPPAAAQLNRNIQQNGLLLGPAQVRQVQDLFATTTDARLKDRLAPLIGTLRPSATATGERLRDFVPSPRGRERE